MKKLSQLLMSIKPIQVVGNTDIEIQDVINDSRKAREGVLSPSRALPWILTALLPM